MSKGEVAVVYEPLNVDEISAILAAHGAIDEAGDSYIRMKVQGTNFITDDDVWMSNPKTGAPAFKARLIGPPIQYQAFWFDAAAAERAGRPDMVKRFCKSHYDNPNEAREYGTNGASCRACPFNPFGSERPKCQWRGDVNFQIIDDEQPLTGDEPIYTMSFSITSMIEYKGTKRAPNEGSVSTENFMYKLAKFSIGMASEWGVSPEQAIIIGLSALNEGMVAVEFRALTARSEELGREWSVVSMTPYHVQKPDTGETKQIGDGTSIADDLDF